MTFLTDMSWPVSGGWPRLVRGMVGVTRAIRVVYRGPKTNTGSPIPDWSFAIETDPCIEGIYRPGCSRGLSLKWNLESAPGHPPGIRPGTLPFLGNYVQFSNFFVEILGPKTRPKQGPARAPESI